MKIKNKRVYNSDPTVLATLREEYTSMGFDTSMETGCLVVYVRKRKKPKPKADESKPEKSERSRQSPRF